MNRRNFIGGVLSAFAGIAILPSATTYNRVWKIVAPKEGSKLVTVVPNPEWVNAPYELSFVYNGQSLVIMDRKARKLSEAGVYPRGNVYPCRYRVAPPIDIWINDEASRKWASENYIAPFMVFPHV